MKSSPLGRWDYSNVHQYPFGSVTVYEKIAKFIDDHGLIEDWGCGTAFLSTLVKSEYRGIDGSPGPWTAEVVDLIKYKSSVDCVVLRGVLEHNWEWKKILDNALYSFKKRMVLGIFTPMNDENTKQIGEPMPGIPDLSFKKSDLLQFISSYLVGEEFIPPSDTLFLLERKVIPVDYTGEQEYVGRDISVSRRGFDRRATRTVAE